MIDDGVDEVDFTAAKILTYIKNVTLNGASGMVSFNDNLENENTRYSVTGFVPFAGTFLPAGEWNPTSGFVPTPGFLNYRSGSIPMVDAFPPDAVSTTTIVAQNVSVSEATLTWFAPDTKSARNVSYNVGYRVKGSFSNYTLSQQVTTPMITLSGLKSGTVYEFVVYTTTHAGSSTSIPSTMETARPITYVDVSSAVAIPMFALTALLAMWSLGVQGMTVIKSNEPVIKASSVPFLHVILVGSLFAYAAVYASAFHDTRCTVYPVLLSLAFVLIFGSLFARTLRIYRIFLSNSLRVKAISNKDIWKQLGIALSLEMLIIVIWFSVDMPRQALHVDESDPYRRNWTCETNYATVWWSAMLVPKFMVLAFGSYLAIKLRNVTDNFNESKYIGAYSFLLHFFSFSMPL